MAAAVATMFGVILAGLAGYGVWSQLRMLRSLPGPDQMPAEDRLHFRRQAVRRLFGAAVLTLLAVMLVTAFVLGWEARMDELGTAERPLADGQIQFVRHYALYWIVVLLLVFVSVLLAAADLWAIRRYGQRHHRRIRDDRKAMLERQLVELKRERRERNGRAQ